MERNADAIFSGEGWLGRSFEMMMIFFSGSLEFLDIQRFLKELAPRPCSSHEVAEALVKLSRIAVVLILKKYRKKKKLSSSVIDGPAEPIPG